MKRFCITILSTIFLLASLSAQNLSVSGFRPLETDLTANTHGTMETDQNGETAALIKVVTTQTDFTFEAGMLGIVKTRQNVGEIWVYVPKGGDYPSVYHDTVGLQDETGQTGRAALCIRRFRGNTFLRPVLQTV